jgi:signal transduction histidine kinase
MQVSFTEGRNMFGASNASRSGLLGRTIIISLTVALLIMLGFVHFKWWPWMMARVTNATTEGRNWCNYRLDCAIQDGVKSVWVPHSLALLEVEEKLKNAPVEYSDIEELANLPGVLEAFYLNLSESQGVIVNNLVSVDTLLVKLDLRQNEHSGGGSPMMRRLVGGITRFKDVKSETGRLPLLIRYAGSYYPALSNEIIGLVLDKEWYIKQLPSLLDSLARDNTNLLFFAHRDMDKTWANVEDPYASPGNAFKQTIGVLNGKDTLWWYGDRKMDMKYRDSEWEYIGLIEGFNLTMKIKTEFPRFTDEILAGKKTIRLFFMVFEFMGVLLIVVLSISIAMTNKQASRNQIALAHLAHAIKTPVARIRLDTDSLLEEMVASPDEEREIITAIGRECGRMERAVQSAALSLEEGKRTLNLEAGDLAKLVIDTTQAWQPQFAQAGIKLKIDTIDETFSGRFDAEMIAIMIDNLLDNALRHTMLNLENTKQNATVTVTLKRSDGKAEIIIDDMGAGIPAKERKHIFKRFQRVRGDAASGVSGLGLGLALVKEIAEAHNGNVSVSDNDIHGARFVVQLPFEV